MADTFGKMLLPVIARRRYVKKRIMLPADCTKHFRAMRGGSAR